MPMLMKTEIPTFFQTFSLTILGAWHSLPLSCFLQVQLFLQDHCQKQHIPFTLITYHGDYFAWYLAKSGNSTDLPVGQDEIFIVARKGRFKYSVSEDMEGIRHCGTGTNEKLHLPHRRAGSARGIIYPRSAPAFTALHQTFLLNQRVFVS